MSISEQAFELAEVRTAAGVARFHQPIGSTIGFETGRMKTSQLPPPRQMAPRQYNQDEMVRSVRRHGVEQPIALRHNQSGLLMANGEHRAQAAREAGVPDVPVIVQHSEGVNPRSVPIIGRQPASLADWEKAWNQMPSTEIAASISDQLGIELAEHVKTAAGAAFYHEPIGALIVRHHYEPPDHSRLLNARSPYHDPGDHPWFQGRQPDPKNIIAKYYDASPDQVQQGMHWYQDAHEIAAAISPDDPRKGAGVISAYSPQTGWPVNMLNAARALAGGRAIGPGEGMITSAMQRSAQRIMNGEDPDKVLKAPKTNAFFHLISRGADADSDPLGKVVIDRHAVSVAIGHRVTKDENGKAPIDDDRYYQHVADAYRHAALAISQKEGHQVTPHQLQAITWLRQQEESQEADSALGQTGVAGRLGKGRETSLQKSEEAWNAYTGLHPAIPVHEGTTLFRAAEPITAAEARGNSRPVSAEEFQRLASAGRARMRQAKAQSKPASGLHQNLAKIKDDTYAEVQNRWGGATIDAHTGQVLPQGAHAFALSVKPAGMNTISIPEHATKAEFSAAVDQAVKNFDPVLQRQGSHLGVFHDDDNNRIDIDPVMVVSTPAEVEQIGAYTHAIGGAYDFSTGDGYFPPHVAETGGSNAIAVSTTFQGAGALALAGGRDPAAGAGRDREPAGGRGAGRGTISGQLGLISSQAISLAVVRTAAGAAFYHLPIGAEIRTGRRPGGHLWQFMNPDNGVMRAHGAEPLMGHAARDSQGIWGNVVAKHGDHVVIDANDRHRHLVNWKIGGDEQHNVPLNQVEGVRPEAEFPGGDPEAWTILGQGAAIERHADNPRVMKPDGALRPQLGDKVRMPELNGRPMVIGTVVATIGDKFRYAVVDGDDGNRHLMGLDGHDLQSQPLSQIPANVVPAGWGRVMLKGQQVPRTPAAPAAQMPVGRGDIIGVPQGKEARARQLRAEGMGPESIRGQLAAEEAQRNSPAFQAGEPQSPPVYTPRPVTANGHDSAANQRLEKLAAAADEAESAYSNMITRGGAWRKSDDATSVSTPGQGIQGSTRIITLADGSKVLRKSIRAGWGSDDMADKEELASYVGRAIGAGSPAVAHVPGRPGELIEDVVPGQTATRWLSEQHYGVDANGHLVEGGPRDASDMAEHLGRTP
ncbi:MAG: ParB/RepB/Spo0J family partition protein, partial [Streptosporangiaceae bacterium]